MKMIQRSLTRRLQNLRRTPLDKWEKPMEVVAIKKLKREVTPVQKQLKKEKNLPLKSESIANSLIMMIYNTSKRRIINPHWLWMSWNKFKDRLMILKGEWTHPRDHDINFISLNRNFINSKLVR